VADRVRGAVFEALMGASPRACEPDGQAVLVGDRHEPVRRFAGEVFPGRAAPSAAHGSRHERVLGVALRH
jgi:hypothetical protein